MSECIHGLDTALCDVCSPKPAPEVPSRSAAPRSSSPRSTAPRSSTPRGTAATRPAGTRPAMLRIGELRVYHVTHIRNLPAILEQGALIAGSTPVVDVSSELARELRATAEAAGRPVAEYVPFSLAPDSASWDELRRGAAVPRWSAAARASVPSDFVVLVTTVAALGPDAVITDGDAAGTYTRFATGEDAGRMLARLHGDPEARATAEALAPDSVDFSSIQVIGVANEPVRDDVRVLLAGSGFTARIAVYPPWFATE